MPEPLTDREIYKLLEEAIGLFKGAKGATEGGQAVIDLFLKNTDFIQRAQLIMLAENRPTKKGSEEP